MKSIRWTMWGSARGGVGEGNIGKDLLLVQDLNYISLLGA